MHNGPYLVFYVDDEGHSSHAFVPGLTLAQFCKDHQVTEVRRDCGCPATELMLLEPPAA